ncbi:hypothetical protein NSMM_920001 [Nitrosomonas mobilis]|uniref:Uncharacterized protein n=1 Tax=Nitrosomonas mobilis TaxID=51642 RepID=A0A1G5SJJ1_9PROT|nr:hypothetical protein NSMM_920001 [Nitrosomonas mobilis]
MPEVCKLGWLNIVNQSVNGVFPISYNIYYVKYGAVVWLVTTIMALSH